MTTIVIDLKNSEIACDSRISAGELIVSDDGIKFKRVGEHIYFIAGLMSDFDDFLSKFDNRAKSPVDYDIVVVRAGNDGVYVMTYEYEVFILERLNATGLLVADRASLSQHWIAVNQQKRR